MESLGATYQELGAVAFMVVGLSTVAVILVRIFIKEWLKAQTRANSIEDSFRTHLIENSAHTLSIISEFAKSNTSRTNSEKKLEAAIDRFSENVQKQNAILQQKQNARN